MNEEDREGNGVINMSLSILSGNFEIKNNFILKLGGMCWSQILASQETASGPASQKQGWPDEQID